MKKIVDDICNGDLLSNSGDYDSKIETNTGVVLVVTMTDTTDDTEYVVMVTKQKHNQVPPDVEDLPGK